MGRKLVLRFVLIAAIVGVVWYWQKSRKPVTMTLKVDLSEAHPAQVSGLDVVVRRNDRLLNRHEISQFSDAGAPSTLEMVVYAPPGRAEVEATVNYAGKPSRRTLATVDLQADEPTTVKVH